MNLLLADLPVAPELLSPPRGTAPALHLLLVEHDRDARAVTAEFLAQHGFRVTAVGDAAGLWKAHLAHEIDLVVLNLALPGEDGFSLCRRLRQAGSTPIVLLGPPGDGTDRIVGLELGADDVLSKPCNPRELLARIRAVLRRTQRIESTAVDMRPYRFEGFTLDPARRELHDGAGEAVGLSSGEFALLYAFVRQPMQVLTREALFALAHGRTALSFGRSIDVQISRLRRKLGDDSIHPRLIKTVRFGGYVLTVPVERGLGTR